MLPPPITMPSAAPVATTETTSSASRFTVSKSYPNPLSPARASPESLSKTRGYFRSLMNESSSEVNDPPASRFAQLVANEAPHLDVLTRLRGRFFHEIADRLLGIAHPRLVEQRDVFIECLDLALDDLVDHVLRLSLGLDLFDEDAALGVDLVLRHLILVDGNGSGGRDVFRDRLAELLKVFG